MPSAEIGAAARPPRPGRRPLTAFADNILKLQAGRQQVRRPAISRIPLRQSRNSGSEKGKSTEEIIGFLREAEVRIAQGETAGKICRGAGISEQTYYKWRREYGGLKIDQAKRLKELERENERLKKVGSELTFDKLILKEALSGKY